MLTPNSPDAALLIPADIYRRAAVRDFETLVNDQVPDLETTLDKALAMAYYFAYIEQQGTDVGAAARAVMAPLFGITTDQAEGLLAAFYLHISPSLAPKVSAE